MPTSGSQRACGAHMGPDRLDVAGCTVVRFLCMVYVISRIKRLQNVWISSWRSFAHGSVWKKMGEQWGPLGVPLQ